MLNESFSKKQEEKTHVMFDFENPGKKVTKDLSFPGSKSGYCHCFACKTVQFFVGEKM